MLLLSCAFMLLVILVFFCALCACEVLSLKKKLKTVPMTSTILLLLFRVFLKTAGSEILVKTNQKSYAFESILQGDNTRRQWC